jgi:hypothetical protein
VTRDQVLRWLAARRPEPPPLLRPHLEAALADSAEPLPEQLARSALARLEQVAGGPARGRDVAMALLAADALVTYAFEAQAEQDVNGLAGLAERVAKGWGTVA